MYDADEEFRAAVNQSMPDLPMLRLAGSDQVGARLEEELLQLVTSARQPQQPQSPTPPQQQQQPAQPQGGGAASTS